MCLEVCSHLRASRELGEECRVPPRCIDEHIRSEHVRVPLKTHLVVAATRGAVREHLDAFLLHRPHEAVAGDDASNAGGVPVAAVVAGLTLDHLEAPVSHRLLERNDDRLHAARGHAALDVLNVILVGLAEVGREGEDLDAGLDETLRYRLRVQATGHAHAHLLAHKLVHRERRRRHFCFCSRFL